LFALTQEGQPDSNIVSCGEHGESAQSESARINERLFCAKDAS